MTEHFTRNTVSASFWCNRCSNYTQHRIDGGRKGPCMVCMERSDREHVERGDLKPDATERQRMLFEDAS